MKKLSLALIAAGVFVASNANAKDGAYVGVDVLRSSAKHTYVDKRIGNPKDGDTSRDNSSIGLGLNAGYKFSFDKAFVAPEAFYEYLNSSAKDFYNGEGSDYVTDRMKINYRFGAKLNLGYTFVPGFSGFVNAGLSDLKSTYNWDSAGRSRGVMKLGMVYGLGFAYDLNEKWTIRTSFDRQNINLQYMTEGRRDKVRLDVLKVGLVYNF